MKNYYRFVFMVAALLVSACSLESPENGSAGIQKTTSQPEVLVPAEAHYVRVVLPPKESVKGAVITINMEDAEPMTHQFSENLNWENPNERTHIFVINKPLKPATMMLTYNDGTSHTMSQVIFDTTIETP